MEESRQNIIAGPSSKIKKQATSDFLLYPGGLGGILICAGAQINSWGVASKYPKQALDIYSAPTTSEPYGFSSR